MTVVEAPNDRVTPIGQAKSLGGYASAQAAKAYRANVPSAEDSDAARSSPSGPSRAARLGRLGYQTAPTRSTRRRAVPVSPPEPTSPYARMLAEDLHRTIRTAEGLRRGGNDSEPSPAYLRSAARVYALTMEGRKEIARLRAEGISEMREWFA